MEAAIFFMGMICGAVGVYLGLLLADWMEGRGEFDPYFESETDWEEGAILRYYGPSAVRCHRRRSIRAVK